MKRVHLIGNSHLDPVWLWRWQDGYSEVIATFRSALDRMKAFDDFKYTSSSAIFYKWIEKTDPEMLYEIKERIREGRWEVIGGWLIEPDCNIPSGESFARHALLGLGYLEEKLGATVKTGYNIDSFGHNASLPKILRASGMDSYVFMRPADHEMNLPSSTFLWEADDGSSVTAYRIPRSYAVKTLDVLEDIKSKAVMDGIPKMAFYGVGNHGGGPTHALIREIKDAYGEEANFSTVGGYFENINKAELSTVKGELQHHARGCYSANSTVKAMNRRSEENLLEAERLALLANRIAGYEYPRERLARAWERVLFNQFHDIIAGCAVKSAYTDASYAYGESLAISEEIICDAMQRIAININTGETMDYTKKQNHWLVWESESIGMPIIVFNSQPFAVKSTVRLKISASRITDELLRDVPFQRVRGEQTMINYTYEIAFPVELPPLSYRVYRAFQEKTPEESFPDITCTEGYIENDFISVEFDSLTGEVARIFDKTTGEYISSRAFGTAILDETKADTWAHRLDYLGDKVGSFSAPEFTVAERGPVLSTLRVTQHYGTSSLTRYYTLYKNSNILHVHATLDFYEKHRAVKLTFPAKDSIACDVPYGSVTRQLSCGEEPMGRWFASGALAVANKSMHGYDSTDTDMRMTLIRTAIYADHFGRDGSNSRDDRCEHMDIGKSEFDYSVFKNASPSHNTRMAEVLHTPPRVITGSFHSGSLPLSYSGFECSAENVAVTALKLAEKSDATVLRFYEACGVDTEFKATLFGKEISCNVSKNAIVTLDDCGKKLLMTEKEIRQS